MSASPNLYETSNGLRNTVKGLFFLRQVPSAELSEGRMMHLGDVAGDVIANLRVFAVYVFLSLILALAYLSLSTPRYSVTLQLIPIPSWLRSEPIDDSQPLSSLLGTQQTSLYTIFSRATAIKQIYVAIDKTYAARQHYFPDQWDPVNKKWVSPSGLPGMLRNAVNQIKGLVGFPIKTAPTIDDLRRFLLGTIEITVNEDQSVLLEMKSKNPAYDAQVLQFLVSETDKVVRAQMLDYVNANIAGLQSQLESQTDTALRTSLIQKLASDMARRAELQNSRIMTLNLNNVEISDTPVYPSFPATIIVFLMIGVMVPMVIIVFRRLTG